MRNDTKTIIKIEMNNVDHANNLIKALDIFFNIASRGGDTELCWSNEDDLSYCGTIGHDVRKPKISISYDRELRTCEDCGQHLFSCICK